MLLGAMNHPMRNTYDQVRAIGEAGFDFLDLTLEPDEARAQNLDVSRLRRSLDDSGLRLVGHTPWFLPIASPYEDIRQAAMQEIRRCFDVLAALGARTVTVHPDQRVSLFNQDWVLARNIESLSTLAPEAARLDLRLVLENMYSQFNQVNRLREVFEAVPDLGFHLDVGHANLQSPRNLADELLASFGDRLEHVHFSDNKGGDLDQHLPLGVGTIDWQHVVRLLKSHHYDGTITLEVFAEDPDYLAVSQRKIRKLWAEEMAL